MAFKYSLRQKRMAKQNDSSILKKAYQISERNLNYFACKGSNKELDKAMQKHRDIEYALLYQQSPEFHKEMCKKKNIVTWGNNGRIYKK